MQAWKLILLCPLLFLGLLGFAPAPAPHYGPCKRYVAFAPGPIRKCEITCFVLCLDPCKKFTYAPGGCQNVTGNCTEITVSVPKRRCRDCFCPIAGPLCLNYGLYNTGSEDVTDCS